MWGDRPATTHANHTCTCTWTCTWTCTCARVPPTHAGTRPPQNTPWARLDSRLAAVPRLDSPSQTDGHMRYGTHTRDDPHMLTTRTDANRERTASAPRNSLLLHTTSTTPRRDPCRRPPETTATAHRSHSSHGRNASWAPLLARPVRLCWVLVAPPVAEQRSYWTPSCRKICAVTHGKHQ